jgi:hypothetical protein
MTKSVLLRIPLIGIPLFIILYVWASMYYPGGSQTDQHSVGFSWMDNYWCNLLNTTAINGEPNHSKPIAMAGMLVLAVSFVSFWIGFATVALYNKLTRKATIVSGVLAMATALLLNTSLDHDLVTNLASISGLLAVGGTLIGLYKLQWRSLFWFGLINLILVVINNLFYYNPSLIGYLPLVQKITFGLFLMWFFLISWRISSNFRFLTSSFPTEDSTP